MTVGVVLMAYGTPAGPEDVEAYYTHIRRGRPAPPELLADLRRRYTAIGGTSPLLEITRAQADGVARDLGHGFRVVPGMKHAPPFLEDAVAELARSGVRRTVGLVLAPHYSALSVGEYVQRARAAAEAAGPLELSFIEHWHLAPDYVELLSGRVADALGSVPAPASVVFTAHSLPARIVDEGDPYPIQLAETAAAVAARVGLPSDAWRVGWQSAGRTEEAWLGPGLLEVLAEEAAAGRAGVLVCPAGFVSDHLEVLYDLDVEARDLARRLGLGFSRTALPNADPRFCAILAGLVRQHLGRRD